MSFCLGIEKWVILRVFKGIRGEGYGGSGSGFGVCEVLEEIGKHGCEQKVLKLFSFSLDMKWEITEQKNNYQV